MRDIITDWKTTKSTTDKLATHLIEVDDSGYEPFTVQFVGGRDWVIVSFKEAAAQPPIMGTFNGEGAGDGQV